MENASKALIIAGAILLAILLISLGIMIFNQAQDTVSSSGMSQAQVTAFNDQFIKYEGDRKGTMVKSMVQEVLAVNADKDTNDGITVAITTSGTNATGLDLLSSTSSIVNGNTYKIKLSYDSAGRVNSIDVNGTFEKTT